MIQDIAPHLYENAFAARRSPAYGDVLLLYRGNAVLVKKDEAGEIRLPVLDRLLKENPGFWAENLIYLFRIDQIACYGLDDGELIERAAGQILPDGVWLASPDIRTAKPRHAAFAAITGMQLSRWRNDHRYCGRCGEKMIPSDTERALTCPNCRSVVYPKISPAVIVAVTNGGRILLTKYAGRSYARYALIAGFTEIGETIEETVHREVLEEVGLRVKNLRYYKSQPWSFSDTLLMGFFCEVDGEAAITLDRDELSLATWMKREDMPDRSDDISLTSEMMEVFRNNRILP